MTNIKLVVTLLFLDMIVCLLCLLNSTIATRWRHLFKYLNKFEGCKQGEAAQKRLSWLTGYKWVNWHCPPKPSPFHSWHCWRTVFLINTIIVCLRLRCIFGAWARSEFDLMQQDFSALRVKISTILFVDVWTNDHVFTTEPH